MRCNIHSFCGNFLFILTTVFFFNGCLSDDFIIENSGSRLIRINYDNGTRNWSQNFNYSSEGKLLSVNNSDVFGRNYELVYEVEKVKEIISIRVSDDSFIDRDEFHYNEFDEISLRKYFRLDSNEDEILSLIDTFKYDSSNRIIELVSVSVLRNNINYIRKFYWGDDNIEREEYCDENGEVQYEYFYSYDDKNNFKKDLGLYLSDPLNWSNNNIFSTQWNDYYGNLDLICRPCNTYYTYNNYGLPVILDSNTGWRTTQLYE